MFEPLRLLCDETDTYLPGWTRVQSKGRDVALFQSDAGLVAGVSYLDLPKPARATDVNSALKKIFRKRSCTVEVGVLYARNGYTEVADRCVARRQTTVALLGPHRRDELDCVTQYAGSVVERGSPRAQFVDACLAALQVAMFGVVPVSADGHTGFTTFSVDTASVYSMRFMAERECERTRLELIRSAKASVIYSTFNFSHKSLAMALEQQASGGVRVVCILSNKSYLEGKHKRWIASLRASGVEVFSANNHAKCLIVDGETVLFGSANASPAEHQCFEFNMEVRSKDLARRLIELWRVLVPEASSTLSSV